MQSAIQHTNFFLIQRIAPLKPLAIRLVCVLKKKKKIWCLYTVLIL